MLRLGDLVLGRGRLRELGLRRRGGLGEAREIVWCGTVQRDPGLAGAMLLHQREELCGVGGVQPDAAMRGRAAERADGPGAMDCVAAAEEHGMGHRAAIFARVPVLLQPGRPIDAVGRTETLAAGRDLPVVDLAIGRGHRHALGDDVDIDADAGMGGAGEGRQDEGGQEAENATHHTHSERRKLLNEALSSSGGRRP